MMLKNKKFVSLFTGQTISNIGEQLYLIAVPWLVFELTQSTLTMGTVSAVIAFPQIIFGLLIGVLIDRFNKRKLMIYSTFLQIILMTLFPTLYLMDILSIYHIYIICFLYSIGSLVFLSTYRSTVPQLVNKNNLVKVNSLIQSSLTIVRIIGPIFAGIIISKYGAQNALYVNMISFLILYCLLLFIRLPEESQYAQKQNKKSLIKEIEEGFKFIFHHKRMFYMNILTLFVNIGMSIGLSMMVFYLRGDNLLSAEHVGYVYSISGGMAFLFTLIAPKLIVNSNYLKGILISCSISGLALTLISLPFEWVTMGLLLGFITGGGTLASIYINTFLQSETPDHLIGRIFTTSQMLARVSTPISVFIGGWLTNSLISISQLFLFSGIIIMLSTLIAAIVLKNSKNSIKVAI